MNQRTVDLTSCFKCLSNSTLIWLAGEYIKNSPSHNTTPTWSTFIGSITFDCVSPTTGDWTVTASCTLASSATPAANVIVQNNSLLTIPNGVSLNIDFTHYHLLVKSGRGCTLLLVERFRDFQSLAVNIVNIFSAHNQYRIQFDP